MGIAGYKLTAYSPVAKTLGSLDDKIRQWLVYGGVLKLSSGEVYAARRPLVSDVWLPGGLIQNTLEVYPRVACVACRWL